MSYMGGHLSWDEIKSGEKALVEDTQLCNSGKCGIVLSISGAQVIMS